MTSVQLSLKNLFLSFGPQVILRDANLDVQRGECVVLIGPSGEGKTVTLKLFAGLLAPDQGQVEVRADRLQIGMLFQKNALFDSLTCGENIAFPLREKSKLSEREIQDRVAHYLEAVGLATSRDLYPIDISGGMQKRLGIARALALDPQIVLYDDPTAGLDPITSRKIVDLILRLRRERGSTIIAVTNDMARAYQLADRIVMVTDGEIIVTGDPAATRKHQDSRVYRFIRGQSAESAPA